MAGSTNVDLAPSAPQPSAPDPVATVRRLPLPVLAIIVGGGVGGVLFLLRKSQARTEQTAQGTPQQLLPNTAVMLGSLQQGVLDLEGQIGQGFGGVNQNISESQSALLLGITNAQQGLAGNLTTVAGNLTDLITATGQKQADALSHSQGVLQSAIDSLGTQITGLGENQGALKDQLTAAQQALQGQLAAVQSDISNVNQSVGGLTGQVQAASQTSSQIAAQFGGFQNALTNLAGLISSGQNNTLGPWAAYEGKIVAQGEGGSRTDPNHTWTYYVHNGKLYGIGSGASFLALTGMSQADYAAPGKAEAYVTKVPISDASLRASMAGVL